MNNTTETKSPAKPRHVCRHTDGVVCWPGARKCDKCGFDPDVARRRLEKYCEKHGIDLPKGKE